MRNGVRIFPCRPVAVIQTELQAGMTAGGSKSSEDKETLEIENLSEQVVNEPETESEDEEASELTHCPACAVKDLVQCYWGDQNLDAAGVPKPLLATDPQLVMVDNVDNALRMFTPGAAMGAADTQEDPEEMQTRLLTACLESVDYK
jgi:hypothetical protein